MTGFEKVKLGLGVAAALGVSMVGSEVSESVRKGMSGGKLVKFLSWFGLLGLTVAAGTLAGTTVMDVTDSVKDLYDESRQNFKK